MCGACQAVCPGGAHILTEQGHEYDGNKCVSCGKCAQICPTGALEADSREHGEEEMLKELLLYRAF